jgi:hypothetical protein
LACPRLERKKKTNDIVPSTISKRKNFSVSKVINQDFWNTKIKSNEGITIINIAEFADLWMDVNGLQLTEGTTNDTTWKFTTS